jgi:hypothetical protein
MCQNKKTEPVKDSHALAAAAFLGAAFFGAAAFLVAGFCVLATRPDLVLVRTVSGFSAWKTRVSLLRTTGICATKNTYLGRGSLLSRSGLLGSGSLLGGSGLLLGLGGGSLLGGSGLLGSRLLGGGLLLGSDSLLLLLGLGLLLGELGAAGGALGLLKDTLLNTALQGLVEQSIEHVVRDRAQLVVGLDVLLELLTAIGNGKSTVVT